MYDVEVILNLFKLSQRSDNILVRPPLQLRGQHRRPMDVRRRDEGRAGRGERPAHGLGRQPHGRGRRRGYEEGRLLCRGRRLQRQGRLEHASVRREIRQGGCNLGAITLLDY